MENSGKKKLLMMGAIIIGLVVFIVIVLLIYHAISGNKKLSYKEIENKVIAAAKKYYGDNEKALPKEDGEQVTISDSKLTSAGYLKDLSSYASNNTKCSANVYTTKQDSDYRYTVFLDCGKDYSVNSFAQYLKSNVEKVVTGEGLYELNGEYVYRGNSPKNYLKIEKNYYRIVKITGDNVLAILETRLDLEKWDDRYNIDINNEYGVNTYEVSRIKEYLDDLYKSNSKVISNKEKKYMANQTLYVGKRSIEDTFNDGSIEKSETIENQKFGLLPLYDYINASVDENCLTAENISCENYNYLVYYNRPWWTITSDSNTSYKTYLISQYGEINLTNDNMVGYVRPTVMLINDIVYSSGDGSYENPYTIK